MEFNGAARRLDDIDLPRLGALIGVGEDELHAVMDVESRGSGFDSRGRPAMLFEPHVFYRLLRGTERDAAVALGLARREWRRDYPPDSYPRLIRAMEINAEQALRSASWGLFQIMGFNAEACGYASARAMVEAFREDEEHHMQAVVAFLRTMELDDDLRRHDWAGFARGYNGPRYAENQYDKKLARAFAKWKAIPDTPWKRGTVIATVRGEPVAVPAADAHPKAPDPDPEVAPRPVPVAVALAAMLAATGGALVAFACKVPVLNSLISSCGG